MGKSLIIKGTDFSLNALDSIWNESPLVQGYVNTNSGSGSYGRISIMSSSYYMNLIMAKILIPSGKTVSVKITNNDVIISDFLLGYVTSPNDIALVDENVVTNIDSNLHPLSSAPREDDGSFTITNSSNNDLYYYMDFGYDTINGPQVPVSGKKCLYKRINAD